MAGAVFEDSATCCKSSVFTPGQPPASMMRSAIERAPPTASTPTGWPTMSLQVVFAGSVEASTQSGLGKP